MCSNFTLTFVNLIKIPLRKMFCGFNLVDYTRVSEDVSLKSVLYARDQPGSRGIIAILVFLSLKSFERLAHEIEYANEFCTAVVDVLILLTLEPSGDASQQRWQRPT